MSFLALSNQLQSEEIPLEQIYLDPNNPRFVDSNWDLIPNDQISDADIQEQTRRRLVHGFDIDKLKMNMEVNGYLPIDRVIVKEFEQDKYVVLEGNRRICSAKMIASIASDGSEVPELVMKSIEYIPVLIYTGGDTDAAWIFQGLRHISGVKEWSAFNKAKLLVEQMESEDINLTEVGRRFGLTPHGAGQWARGFYAFKQAKEESDFISEVDERSYPYLQELFSRSSAPIREWLNWDENEKKFANSLNFNEFVGWLYPRPTNDIETGVEKPGNFDERWLARRDDIRDLSYLYTKAQDLFQQFRSSGQLEEFYSIALARQYEQQAKEESDPVDDLFSLLAKTSKSLENLPLKALKDQTLKAKLDELIIDLEEKIDYVKD